MKPRLVALITGLLICTLSGPSACSGEPRGAAPQPVSFHPFRDAASGIRVDVPDGWNVEKSNGMLFITKDRRQTTGVIIVPARLDVERTPEAWLERFVTFMGDAVRKNGGEFRKTQSRIVENRALAEIEGLTDGERIGGALMVDCQPGFLDMTFLFAPTRDFAREGQTLIDIVKSYHRSNVVDMDAPSVPQGPSDIAPTRVTPPTLALRPWQGRCFRAGLPPGWEVAAEDTNSLTLLDADRSAAVAAVFLTRLSSPPDLSTFSHQLFSNALRNLTMGPAYPIQPVGGQGEWVAFSCEGIDIYGRPARGRILAGRDANSLGYVYMGQLEVAQSALWPSRAGILNAVRASIAVTDAASASMLGGFVQLGNNPNDSSGIIASGQMRSDAMTRSSQGWHNAMMGTTRVQSPSLGTTRTISQSQFWSTGPDGPGYYRALPGGGFEKLQETR